jgi:hypothetical protein
MPEEKSQMAIVLVELHKGSVSVALRFGQSTTIQVLDGWEDLTPEAAVRIAMDIRFGRISTDVVANKPYREVTMPASSMGKLDL